MFDLIEIARSIEKDYPGLARWEVCGTGPDFKAFVQQRDRAGLQDVLNIRGHVFPQEMQEVLAKSHAAIVPTKSSFEEGMALSAVEPALANRPVITSSVVPAAEVLGDACLLARTDGIQSYVDQVVRLARNEQEYFGGECGMRCRERTISG